MSRAWFALAFVGVLGLLYVGYSLDGGSKGLASGQEIVVKPLFKKPPEMPSLKFDYIGSNGNTEIYRAKVWGGWLLSASENPPRNGGLSVAFVPDPEHKWDGNSLP